MKRLFLTLALAALPLATLVACSNSDSDGQTSTPSPASPTASPTPGGSPTPVPTEQPSPTPTVESTETPTSERSGPGHPRGTRTGVPAIDVFLDALEVGDVGSTGDFLHYRPIPCVDPQTAEYSVASPDGVEEGTPVSAFVYSACHGSWASEDMRETLAKSLTEMPNLVHSVYSTPDHSYPTEIDPPDRDITEHDWYSVFWFNDAGDITDLSFGCGHDLDNAINIWGLKGAPVLFAAP